MKISRKVFVALKTFPAWNSDLDQTDLSNKLRICLQKPLECCDLLRNSFCVIEPVNADDQFGDVVLSSQFSYLRFGRLGPDVIKEFRHVYPDWINPKSNDVTISF